MAKKILKYFLYTLSSIIAFVLLISFFIYGITPIYKFPDAVSFSGNSFYNPYKDYDNIPYVRANFHGHSRLGGGFTNGRANNTQDVFQAYYDLEYGFASISNYHNITNPPPRSIFP